MGCSKSLIRHFRFSLLQKEFDFQLLSENIFLYLEIDRCNSKIKTDEPDKRGIILPIEWSLSVDANYCYKEVI